MSVWRPLTPTHHDPSIKVRSVDDGSSYTGQVVTSSHPGPDENWFIQVYPNPNKKRLFSIQEPNRISSVDRGACIKRAISKSIWSEQFVSMVLNTSIVPNVETNSLKNVVVNGTSSLIFNQLESSPSPVPQTPQTPPNIPQLGSQTTPLLSKFIEAQSEIWKHKYVNYFFSL